jgi:hypothetical protein
MHKSAAGPGYLAVGRSSGDNMRFTVRDNISAASQLTELFQGGNDNPAWGNDRATRAIAWGDVDGDGLQELVVGRSAGDNNLLFVFDDRGIDFREIGRAGADWGNNRGVVSLAIGDLDNDGRDEIVVGRNAGPGARLLVYRLGAGLDLEHVISLGHTWGDERSAKAIALGNIDGDPELELAVGRSEGDNTRVAIFDDLNAGLVQIDSVGADWGVDRSANAVELTDVTGDGRAELLVGRDHGDHGRLNVFQLTTQPNLTERFEQAFSLFQVWDVQDRGVVDMDSGDVTGDGRPDLVVGRNDGPGTRAAVVTFNVDAMGRVTGANQIASLGTTWDSSVACSAVAVSAGDTGLAIHDENPNLPADQAAFERAARFDDSDNDGKAEIALGRSPGLQNALQLYEFDGANFILFDQGDFGITSSWGSERGATTLAFAPRSRDRDADGLFDAWELNGLDANCDGAIDPDILLKNPPYNADPDHKDMYLEVDWTENEEPQRDAIQEVIRVFALAPVDSGGTPNPDGQLGITLHVDTGTAADALSGELNAGDCNDGLDNDGDMAEDYLDSDCPLVATPMGGGNRVLTSGPLSRPYFQAFWDVKAANFADHSPGRRYVFRYMISGPYANRVASVREDGAGPGSCNDRLDNGELGDGADTGDQDCNIDPTLPEGVNPTTGQPNALNSCGNGFDDDNDGLIDSQDVSDCLWAGGWAELGGNDLIEFGHDPSTILHEFGHALDLHHGGKINGQPDPRTCKPNYISSMNYYLGPIRQTPTSLQGKDWNGDGFREIFDFSPPRHDFQDGVTGLPPVRSPLLPTLMEASLFETLILDPSDTENMMRFSNARRHPAATEAEGGSCFDGVDGVPGNPLNDGLIDGYNPLATEDGVGSCSNGIDDSMLAGPADAFDIDCQADPDCVGTLVYSPLNLAPDWNGDGIISAPAGPVAIDADIDRDSNGFPGACLGNRGANATIVPSDDWRSISIPFLQFADAPDVAVNPVEGPEPLPLSVRREKWSPQSEPLIGWYVASAEDLTLQSGKVAQWVDRSGNGRHVGMPNPYFQPQYEPTGWNGSSPTISFTPPQFLFRDPWTGPDIWSVPPVGTEKPYTVFAVVEIESVEDAGIVGWWGDGGTVGAGYLSVSGSNLLMKSRRIGVYWGDHQFVGSTPITTTKHVLAYRYDGAGVFTFNVDGLGAQVSPNQGTISGMVAMDWRMMLLVGAQNGLGGGLAKYFTGSISELVVVPRALSDGHVADFRDYARSRWSGLP